MDRSKKHTEPGTPADDGGAGSPWQAQNPSVDGSSIARQLTGELFCIGCGYNLHGLSIRSNCSECGMPVRATILGIVDPHADELEPLFFPRLSAIGLNMWSFGALIAVMMIWVLRSAEVVRDFLGTTWTPLFVYWIGVVGLAASMLGAMTMIRAHRSIHRAQAIQAAIGVSLYAPLIFVYSTIYHGYDLVSSSPLLEPGGDVIERSALRFMIFMLVAGIVWGVRPMAIGLAVRSIVVRTGRVDRQSILVVLASLGIAAAGDLIRVVSFFVPSGIEDVLSIVSIVVISLGSVLFSVGLINISIDTVRLYPVLVRPGVGLSDIFETNQQKSARADRM